LPIGNIVFFFYRDSFNCIYKIVYRRSHFLINSANSKKDMKNI